MNVKQFEEKLNKARELGINIDEHEILVQIGDAILLPLEISYDIDRNMYDTIDIMFIDKNHLKV